MFVHCSAGSLALCSPSEFFFKKFIKTLVALTSVNANLVEVSRLFISNTVCLPKSVLEITSTANKHSIGIVKFTKILINNSIVLSSVV